MTVDLNDSESIAAWIAVAPDRHIPQLRAMWRIWTAFREPIERAVKGAMNAK